MINFGDYTNENKSKVAIYSRSSIPTARCRGLWLWENNALLNRLRNQPDIDKIYLYSKDP